MFKRVVSCIFCFIWQHPFEQISSHLHLMLHITGFHPFNWLVRPNSQDAHLHTLTTGGTPIHTTRDTLRHALARRHKGIMPYEGQSTTPTIPPLPIDHRRQASTLTLISLIRRCLRMLLTSTYRPPTSIFSAPHPSPIHPIFSRATHERRHTKLFKYAHHTGSLTS